MRLSLFLLASVLVSTTAARAALPPDLDSDTFANASDNCRFLANPGQEDIGGLGESSVADGFGDLCQCGDVSGSGRIDSADITALRQMLVDPSGAPLSAAAASRCAVFGDLANCDVVQLTVLRRALEVPSLAPLTDTSSAQHCPAALSERIYVAKTGVLGADGTPASPMLRITDAVVRARADRADSELPSGGGIEIHVGSGTYSGAFAASTPDIEVLPILLNVPHLSLKGATVLTRDSSGLATGAQSGTETTIRPVSSLAATQYLVVIGRTTDGGAGDDVSVEGIIFEGLSPQFHSCAVFVDRVSGFAVRDSIVQNTGYGIFTRLSSGTIERNLLRLDSESGAFVTGGSLNRPAIVTFRGNRVPDMYHGLMAKAIGGVSAPVALGQNTLVLEPIQTLYDRSVPADLLNLPDRLNVSIVGNEFSAHDVFGLRLAATTTVGVSANCSFPVEYQTAGASQPLTATLVADVRENRFLSNVVRGVGNEVAFPCRNDPRVYRFDASSRFLANTYASNSGGKSLFTFSRWSPSLGLDTFSNWKYVEGSTYSIQDPLGELAGYHYDNPFLDPITSAPLNNTLLYNGVVVPPGKFIGP